MKSVSLVFLAALAMAYADESTLKMTKKSSFLSAAEDPLEIIVTKPSAKVRYFAIFKVMLRVVLL